MESEKNTSDNIDLPPTVKDYNPSSLGSGPKVPSFKKNQDVIDLDEVSGEEVGPEIVDEILNDPEKKEEYQATYREFAKNKDGEFSTKEKIVAVVLAALVVAGTIGLFKKSEKDAKQMPEEPETVTTYHTSDFEGWGPGTVVVLSDGTADFISDN